MELQELIDLEWLVEDVDPELEAAVCGSGTEVEAARAHVRLAQVEVAKDRGHQRAVNVAVAGRDRLVEELDDRFDARLHVAVEDDRESSGVKLAPVDLDRILEQHVLAVDEIAEGVDDGAVVDPERVQVVFERGGDVGAVRRPRGGRIHGVALSRLSSRTCAGRWKKPATDARTLSPAFGDTPVTM